ncbi:hypothetical protein PMAYCL1PPCAC_13299, partial [Pristionchus mayeri]
SLYYGSIPEVEDPTAFSSEGESVVFRVLCATSRILAGLYGSARIGKSSDVSAEDVDLGELKMKILELEEKIVQCKRRGENVDSLEAQLRMKRIFYGRKLKQETKKIEKRVLNDTRPGEASSSSSNKKKLTNEVDSLAARLEQLESKNRMLRKDLEEERIRGEIEKGRTSSKSP